jgi:hypothetical protein
MATAQHKRSLRFEIPAVSPSLNVRDRSHWAKLRRWKRDTVLLVRSALRRENKYGAPSRVPCLDRLEGRVNVQLVRYGWNRIKDKDNYYGGVKELLDVLKDEKLFIDDDEQYIDLQIRQEVDRSNQRTLIILEWTEVSDDEMVKETVKTKPQSVRIPLSLYVSPVVAAQIRGHAERLETSISELLQRAWRIAEPTIGAST